MKSLMKLSLIALLGISTMAFAGGGNKNKATKSCTKEHCAKPCPPGCPPGCHGVCGK
jgi:hypothetical protein